MQSFHHPSPELKRLLKSTEELGGYLIDELGPKLLDHRQLPSFWKKLKSDGSEVSSGDLLSNDLIQPELRRHFPGVELISEEDTPENYPIPKDCIVIDPIDGTSGYVRQGEFAIQFAKLKQGKVEMAMVYFPVSKTMLYSVDGAGVFLSEGGSSQQKLVRAAPAQFDPSKISLPPELRPKVPGSIQIDFREAWVAILNGQIDARVMSGSAFAWDLLPYRGLIEGVGGVGRRRGGGVVEFNSSSQKISAIWAASQNLADELDDRLS